MPSMIECVCNVCVLLLVKKYSPESRRLFFSGILHIHALLFTGYLYIKLTRKFEPETQLVCCKWHAQTIYVHALACLHMYVDKSLWEVTTGIEWWSVASYCDSAVSDTQCKSQWKCLLFLQCYIGSWDDYTYHSIWSSKCIETGTGSCSGYLHVHVCTRHYTMYTYRR